MRGLEKGGASDDLAVLLDKFAAQIGANRLCQEALPKS